MQQLSMHGMTEGTAHTVSVDLLQAHNVRLRLQDFLQQHWRAGLPVKRLPRHLHAPCMPLLVLHWVRHMRAEGCFHVLLVLHQ